MTRLEVRAPLAGTVLDMSVFALKSVVRPAEPILYVVPSDADLVVDAEVDPTRIDSVRVGQEALLRFSSFSRRTTPQILGVVTLVSADSFTDDHTGRSYYRAEVVIKEGQIDLLDDQELVAGMPVEVFIQTGERTPINYLLRPITDYFRRALREE